MGYLEGLVLEVIAAENARTSGETYGVPVRLRVEAILGYELKTGAFYTTVNRLAAKRLISIEVVPPTPDRGMRTRKLLRLTPAGEAALARKEALDESVRGLRNQEA